MKIAIVTCERLPQGIAEDQPLFDALKSAQIEFQICVWSDTVDWSQYDICLLRSVWDYHEKSTAFMTWVHQTSQVTKIMNPSEVIEWNSNKNYLKALSEHHINIAPTLWLKQHSQTPLEDAINQLPESDTYFLKPTIGADSSGTHRFMPKALEAAQTHLNQWIVKHDMMLQSYLPSVESYGEVSAIYFGGDFSHAIRKIPVNGDYRVQDTFGAKDIAHTLDGDEFKATEAANTFINKKFGKLAYARIDLLKGDHGQVFVNELELIEPSLFLQHGPNAAELFVTKIVKSF